MRSLDMSKVTIYGVAELTEEIIGIEFNIGFNKVYRRLVIIKAW